MKIKKLGIMLLMICFILASFGGQVFAAEVGDQLLEPEDGWKRYDADLSYMCTYGIAVYSLLGTDNNKVIAINNFLDPDSKIHFKFIGNKLRILGNIISDHDHETTMPDSNMKIIVDGVEYISNITSYDANILDNKYQVVFFDVNLDDQVHEIEICADSNGTTWIDSIDTGENGYVIHPYTPTNLTATPGDSKVDLSWDKVTDADSYIVKRSTTSGGPYTTIAEDITATNYTDTDVVNGTTYYYVVSAVLSGVESENSNEASATPKDSSSSGDRALLRITMSNGTINEYDLSKSDINNFIDWCDNRNKPYYIIEKDYNIKPFESREDYIIFEKISQFEVMEYKN